MIGSDITAEIAMKIGRVLTLKWVSRIASRAALLATNAATTISALIVAIRAAPRWSSPDIGRLRLPLGLLAARLRRHELVMQPAGPGGQHQPAHRERDVQDGERAH